MKHIIVAKPDNMPVIPDDMNIVSTVFLAGTIDNGASEDWQSRYIETLNKYADETLLYDECILVYNPRREHWVHGSDTDMLVEQINWELDALDKCDFIYMNILGDSKSPITLLELGMYAAKAPLKLYVTCPKEFYRYTNVEVVCSRNNVHLRNNEDDPWQAKM